MAKASGLNWQRRRNEFNHDWFKNRYLLALGTWLNILEGAVEDSHLEALFIEDVLPEWEAHRGEVFSLVQQFETAMSPRRLFEDPPLRSWDEETKQWLGEVLHYLWLHHQPVARWVDQAARAARQAEQAYANLNGGIGSMRTVVELRRLRQDFENFHDCCQELSDCISRFPGDIRVA